MSENVLWSDYPSTQSLKAAATSLQLSHLKDIIGKRQSLAQFTANFDGIYLDYTRHFVDQSTMEALFKFATEREVESKIANMFAGMKINETEHRAALHVALRYPSDASLTLEGVNVIEEVHTVLQRIQTFAEAVRSGTIRGYDGALLKDVICIGIGGSCLGTEFVFEALSANEDAKMASQNRRMRILANVDPIDFKRATKDLHPSTTLVIVISKTFSTAETMLNAKLLKQWLLETFQTEDAIPYHMVAVSTNLKLTTEFGIHPNNVFGFWDWVGGRFSVTSAVGVLPLTLHFGWPVVEAFLAGAHAMDMHFKSTPIHSNLPVLMALISFWNTSFLNYGTIAILPYCQALHRFPAHIQQLAMESNGKSVTMNGTILPNATGEIYFGEPGTNGQHSFYQLLHQGRVVPAEFIGFCKSPSPCTAKGEAVSSHDELMSNFFAQPDALAFGKTEEDCIAESIPPYLIPHRIFTGNRPSTMLLLPVLNGYYLGALLALYEHRIVVQAFLWGINPFDQWGVELGKTAAKNIRNYLKDKRQADKPGTAQDASLSLSTKHLLRVYLQYSS